MSVKRYTCAVRNGPNGIYAEMAVRDNGAFVLTEDYEALAVKLAALKAAYNQPVPLSDWQKQQARIAALETALREHNEGCQALCGIGDQEAVACGYRPYFENSGRRCPNCPTYDIIDFPVETACDCDDAVAILCKQNVKTNTVGCQCKCHTSDRGDEAMTFLDEYHEWNEVTGAIPKGTSWDYEIESIFEDADKRIRELEAFLVKVLPAGIEDVCDECGGDTAKCKAENPDCYIAEARRLLPAPLTSRPYPWCRQPSVCRGTCPMDPSCGE